jgi:hypothetical protein
MSKFYIIDANIKGVVLLRFLISILAPYSIRKDTISMSYRLIAEYNIVS